MMRISKTGKLILILSLFSINSAIAAEPTPGKSCPKANMSMVFNDVKYKCTKAAGKLKWNSGTPINVVKVPVPKPSPIQFLAAPSPNLGEISTEIECLKGTCFYDGPVPEGSIIKVKSLKEEWRTYGTTYGISQIFFKATSPSGKITTTIKYNLPYEYDSTSWSTAELGTWSIQVAGWNGNQQTEWSQPRTVQVRVLPQSANGLKKCSAAVESALTNNARIAGNLMREIENAWSKREEIKNKYEYAQLFDRENMFFYLNILNKWDDLLSQSYGSASGLYADYEKTKKICNSQVVFPKYIEVKR
jgi:hypothetical protein